MKLAIELPPAQADKLRSTALGLSIEKLARAALTAPLSTPDADFQGLAHHVITTNREPYRRLA